MKEYSPNNRPDTSKETPLQRKSSGYCNSCKTLHILRSNRAVEACHNLMALLEKRKSIAIVGSDITTQNSLSTDPLFGKARGKMFGVMVCQQPDGSTKTVNAFSGQYNGTWRVDGWAPPLFDVEAFHAMNDHREKEIKSIGIEMQSLPPHSEQWLVLKKERRQLSRELMGDIHKLYNLTNFRNEHSSLTDAFLGENGIPTGTGDCCAPKLLHYAAENQLTPLGIAEFYWGKENRSGTRIHGHFYSSCVEKCAPILGFLLCGIGQVDNE